MLSLILASSSPRRVALLHRLGIPFTVLPADVDEVHEARTSLRELTQINAIMKAEKIAKLHPGAAVIGADTLVSVDGIALAKPADLAEAREMLLMLSGKTHEVCTAVSIVTPSQQAREDFLDISQVTFQVLSEERINQYLDLTSPLDKAGSYGIQDHPELIVSEVVGDLDGIMGLPVSRLAPILRSLGFFPAEK